MAETQTAGTERVLQLLKRSEKAWQRKSLYLAVMREVFDYTQPERNAYTPSAEGQHKNVKVYDSTAVVAATRLANRIQRVLCPPFQRWATLQPGSAIPDSHRQQVKRILEQDTKTLFKHIHASNFDTAFNETAHDLAAGTGVLLIENGRLGGRHNAPALRFTAVPSAQIALENGPFGAVEGTFHKRKEAARNVERCYPDLRAMPRCVAEAMKDQPDREIELQQITCYDPEDAAWKFCVIEPAEKVLMVERRYNTNPWIVIRWQVAPGEVEGRGPLVQALADVKTINKTVELILKNASLAIAGAYTAVDDGVLNPDTVVIAPGAVIPVGYNGGPRGKSLEPLERSGSFDVAQLVLDDLRMTVKKFLYDNQLPPDAGPVRSPTEIVQRMKELQQDIGAAFGRLNQEGIVPIVTRCLDVLDEQGEIVLPLQVDGREIAVQPMSPLAQAQNLDDVQVMADCATVVGSAFGPRAVQAAIHGDKAARRIAELMGVPVDLQPSEEELAAMRQAEQQAMQQELLAKSPAVARVADNATRPQPAPAVGP